MSLPLFWFVSAVLLGILDIFVGSLLVIFVALASAVSGAVSLFIPSVYVQIAFFIFMAFGAAALLYYFELCADQENRNTSFLAAAIDQPVVVHQWHCGQAQVQYQGRIWKASMAFNDTIPLRPGQYKIWKVMQSELLLCR